MLLYKLCIQSLHISIHTVNCSSKAQTITVVQSFYKKPTQINSEDTIAIAWLKLVRLYTLLIKSLHKSTQRVQSLAGLKIVRFVAQLQRYIHHRILYKASTLYDSESAEAKKLKSMIRERL